MFATTLYHVTLGILGMAVDHPLATRARQKLLKLGSLFEALNPAEVFGNIMVGYSCLECTSAVSTSLSLVSFHFRDYRSVNFTHTISKASGYIHRSQWPNGSWHGSWAIRFTHGYFSALESLAAIYEVYGTSKAIRWACEFLASKQKDDGGWVEHFSSCKVGEYVQHHNSQVVNTAWATLRLMSAQYSHIEVVQRGLKVRLYVS